MSVVQPGMFVPAPDAKAPRRKRPRETDAPQRRYTEEEMLEALRRYAEEHDGEAPSQRAYDAWRENAMPSGNNFPRRFGAWTKAIEAAGLTPHHPRPRERYTTRPDAEMLATLLRFLEEDTPTGRSAWGARRFDAWVAENEIDAAKSATYIFRFGTWRNARRLAQGGAGR